MPTVRHAVTLDAPQAEVFAFLADFSNDVRWRAHVLEMRATGDAGPPGGTWSRQVEVRQVPGRVIETEAAISAYAPPERLSVRRATGIVRPEARYVLTPLADGRTRLDFSLVVDLRGAAWLLWPLVALALAVVVRPSLRPDFDRLARIVARC